MGVGDGVVDCVGVWFGGSSDSAVGAGVTVADGVAVGEGFLRGVGVAATDLLPQPLAFEIFAGTGREITNVVGSFKGRPFLNIVTSVCRAYRDYFDAKVVPSSPLFSRQKR